MIYNVVQFFIIISFLFMFFKVVCDSVDGDYDDDPFSLVFGTIAACLNLFAFILLLIWADGGVG